MLIRDANLQLICLGLSLLLPCVVLATPARAAQEWNRFIMMVWQYKTPEPGPEARRLYDSLNLRGIQLDDGFSDRLLSFARENNYPFYVDHAAGKGDLYLRRDEWDAFFKSYRQNRSHPVRPRSIWDPVVIARLKGKLRDNISRAKSGPVLAYAFDDEISITSFTSPADVDWSPEGLRRFRAWLQSEYGTLDQLNAEWNTKFTKWEDVEPKGVDDVRSFHNQPFDRWNLAPWMDHRRFMNAAWADLLAELTREANALDPATPAGFVGGQAPAVYGGYDYAVLRDAVQWMEAYDIGGSNEILRSFWGQSKPHVQTYFLTEKLATDKWFLWYYLVHGNRGVICWPDTDKGPWFQNGATRDSVQALAPTFGEVQGPISEIFAGATFEHDGIALYYSQPSIEASWFMDIAPHGRTWVNRSSSMNNDNASDILNRQAWMKLLEDSGFQYNFIAYRDLLTRGAAALNDYRVLILPRTFALSDREARAIREWVARGGMLIADYLPGVFDEHGKGRATGALDDVFGVQRDSQAGVLDGQSIAEVNAELYDKPFVQRLSYNGARRDRDGFVLYERGLHPTADAKAQEIVDGVASGISHEFQQGSTYYLNWSPLPYLLARTGAVGQQYRRRLIEQLKARDGAQVSLLQPRVRVLHDGQEMPLAERLFWTKNGKHYLCIVMNPLRQATVSSAGAVSGLVTCEPLTINIELRNTVAGLKNERSGRILGDGKSFSDQWVPCEANIYSW
ncbi:MAG: beta-galactosidase [Armatimonadota bacterium]|nr:beta-galactosidase [Armatimonadota bacterium]